MSRCNVCERSLSGYESETTCEGCPLWLEEQQVYCKSSNCNNQKPKNEYERQYLQEVSPKEHCRIM